MQLSNAKLSLLRAYTTSIVQPLDHGVMYSFKCQYRQMLVKRIITQCTTIYTVDQIMGTEFDAIRWIDAAWNNVADIIICNCLLATDFSRTLSNQQTFKNDASSTDNGIRLSRKFVQLVSKHISETFGFCHSIEGEFLLRHTNFGPIGSFLS